MVPVVAKVHRLRDNVRQYVEMFVIPDLDTKTVTLLTTREIREWLNQVA